MGSHCVILSFSPVGQGTPWSWLWHPGDVLMSHSHQGPAFFELVYSSDVLYKGRSKRIRMTSRTELTIYCYHYMSDCDFGYCSNGYTKWFLVISLYVIKLLPCIWISEFNRIKKNSTRNIQWPVITSLCNANEWCFLWFPSWLTSPCGHLWQAVIGVKVKTHINGTSTAGLTGSKMLVPSFQSLQKSYPQKKHSDGIWHLFLQTHARCHKFWQQLDNRQATSWQLHWPLTQPQACSMKLFAWVSLTSGTLVDGVVVKSQPYLRWVLDVTLSTDYSTVAPQSFITPEVILVEQIDMEMPKGLRHKNWTRLSWSSKQR